MAVLEAPGGAAAGLQACLRLGIKVRRYVSLEQRPAVCAVLRRLVPELQREHPLCLQLEPMPVTSGGAPCEARTVVLAQLSALPLKHSGQWLVVGGWGESGGEWSEADMLSVVGGLQQELRRLGCPAPAYVLQGPATTEEQQRLLGLPWGPPCPFDVVQAGVAMHAACALYTNLAAAEHLGLVLHRTRPGTERSLAKLLLPDKQPAVAQRVEPLPLVPVHVPGERLAALPADLSEAPLRQLSDGRPCYPDSIEWEAILGHRAGIAEGLPPALVATVLSEPIAPPTVVCVLASALALQRHYVTPHDTQVLSSKEVLPALVPLGGEIEEHEEVETDIGQALLQRQLGSGLAAAFTTVLAEAADQQEATAQPLCPDVWSDEPVMAALQAGDTVEGGAWGSRRVARRAASYRWDGVQLLRVMANGGERVCPPPEARKAVVEAVHSRLGHLGVRRTLALLQLGHWWFGMRQSVQEVVRQCRACDLSNASGTMRPVQLNPLPVKGLFYRWGVDLAGPLVATADGYKYCMVAIEHFSKHIEVEPLLDKTPARVARAYSYVLARFGAPAEVVTDNGAEFEAEFAELLERCFIDHRPTSASHPQADGAAERVVKVVKAALRKACYEAQDPQAWEKGLPELLLGYRCSPQASTRFSPYQLLYGGVAPVVPPAVRERLSPPINFDDVEAAAESLVERAAWVRQAYPAAAGNLLIAQHRDTLRYSAIRTGRYLAKPVEYAPGDYVYVRRGGVSNTLQFPQHDVILRVESVGPLGVAVLIGRDGARTRRRVEQLLPCHLEVDPIVDTRLFRPARDLQCELCGSPHGEKRMLLCDGCNTGWHWTCLELPKKPEGEWLCPRCRELGLGGPQGPVPEREAAGKLLFPRAATRQRDEEAAALDGRKVQRLEQGEGRGKGKRVRRREGVLEYQGALARPRYFVVRWSGGESEGVTLSRARRMLV